LKVKNPKTDVENEIVLEGLSSFFGWSLVMKIWSLITELILPWCSIINIHWVR
jgi:hypothetical protein